ncbi:hypothetical protein HF855_09215 [Dorea formicigenerans]|uniref:Uncharacterized protein n=1 Tax=Dorea formicigenerans TaxID=39486 RepID=A0A848CQD0_9FIRM|nr:hypothetical protein [Dorea formicigenerans]NME57593.1 hypothetical protein [Dorea formicigenerans]
MKMRWEEPRIEVQKFIPNEYVAACYNISCNVPSGVGYYETNGEPGYQEGGWFTKGDEFIASGTGCGTTHYGVPGVPDDGPVANAMWQESRSGRYYSVFYWEQSSWGHSSSHFSKVEDADWEKNPNAS